MKRYTLKDGHTVDLREPEEVTTRGRRGIQAISVSLAPLLAGLNLEGKTEVAISDLGQMTEEQADAMLRLQEAVVVATVAGWSYPEPVPTLATVGDMPSGRFDEISELSRGIGAALALDTTPTLEPDPKASSGGSEPLVGNSRDGTE